MQYLNQIQKISQLDNLISLNKLIIRSQKDSVGQVIDITYGNVAEINKLIRSGVKVYYDGDEANVDIIKTFEESLFP